MLDTNIISDVVRNPRGGPALRLRSIPQQDLCTSIIVAAELRYGCAKKGSDRLSERVEGILAEIPVLGFDVPGDVAYGMICAELESKGLPIGYNDALIAAHARSLNAIVVTANIREFSRAPDLDVENWLA